MKYSFFTTIFVLFGIIIASLISQHYLQLLGIPVSGSTLEISSLTPTTYTFWQALPRLLTFFGKLLLWSSFIYVPILLFLFYFLILSKKIINK